ncbi:Glycosyltransferase involved in cell wall bisynthesis [Marinobacter sp. es.048]|uniref:glycosyltransferase family 4 protein n=1 Tax=Marinobacter sp. es.048 TaxID=1761795 RepID=UPI000B587A26|nr:glycosyltransferase family 4 protein [Marinobacter sp. es.048]SNC68296.1 Glycosyltransferase involved in cell wall bisynthesis [Marinobacter sp. es.048]SNC74361.1 Glycosyltransferase involved in cell wall bisynthesis [Marinobacter sp. es.048]
MKILMTALQPGGGIRTFFRYVYSQPVFEGYSFTILAPDQGGLEAFLSTFLPAGRIELVSADPGKAGFMRQVRKMARQHSYDLVHSHGFSAGLLTQLALTGNTTPHLMTGHDMFTKPLFLGFRGHVKRLLMAQLFNRMAAVHTVTEDAKRNFLEFFPSVADERVHPILHGVDAKFFQFGTASDIKKEIGLSTDVPLIGFFGRFMSPKGFRVLVEAMDIVRRRLKVSPMPHIVTFGWGGFIREDYAYLKELGLGDYFHQMAQTDNMPGALKGVDLIAMPSRWEACGLLAMEALAAGVPIVGSDSIGLREVLDGSPARQVPVGNAAALAEALVAEIDDIERRREVFQAYQPAAVARFGIERPARHLAELYVTVAASDK